DLGERTGEPLDRDELDALERLYYREATAMQQLLPGVERYLAEARRLGLKTAIASSSRSTWVMEHLERFGIHEHFDAILCSEDVSRTKPDPELYQKAVERLSVSAVETIAFEDSTNGIRAAKAAGLFCVAVPNPLTAGLDLSYADLRLVGIRRPARAGAGVGGGRHPALDRAAAIGRRHQCDGSACGCRPGRGSVRHLARRRSALASPCRGSLAPKPVAGWRSARRR